jgi:hypothetical protein
LDDGVPVGVTVGAEEADTEGSEDGKVGAAEGASDELVGAEEADTEGSEDGLVEGIDDGLRAVVGDGEGSADAKGVGFDEAVGVEVLPQSKKSYFRLMVATDCGASQVF